jgi:predicted metalloprotease with PDZ domain
MRRFLFASFACAWAACATAEIDYHVKVNPTEHRFEVTMTVPVSTAGALNVQIPNWAPGAYFLRDGGQSVQDLSVTDASGAALTVTHPAGNTWSIAATAPGAVKIKYWTATRGGGFGGGGGRGAADDSYIQLSGPSVYMYVVDRKKERCKVTFDVPAGWPCLVGLDATSGPANTYTAPTYDVLADNPMSTGQVDVETYTLRGKTHTIVLEGAGKTLIDKALILKDCRFVSAAETDFWGGAPYHKYVWHFIVTPHGRGGGGLEHLSSTQITLSSDLTSGMISLLAHEYFHLWNVKRVRSSVLGPFDYNVLPKTGALWWLEGVTDYYASLLPYRYGAWTRDQFYGEILQNMRAIQNNPARLTVSANDASLRVGEANGGRGNSNGYQISYYNLGWLCGLCLDTEIRAQTNGKHSLDDVAHALFNECKNDKPGFQEGEIRKLCVKFGGPALGPFYDSVVNQPGEKPIAEQLRKMGLKLDTRDEAYTEVGFNATPSFGSGAIGVGTVRGPAAGKLETGDVITSVNGASLEGKDLRDGMGLVQTAITGAKVGTPIALSVKRGGSEVKVTIDPVAATRPIHTVTIDPAATPSQKALGEAWLSTKTPSAQ